MPPPSAPTTIDGRQRLAALADLVQQRAGAFDQHVVVDRAVLQGLEAADRRGRTAFGSSGSRRVSSLTASITPEHFGRGRDQREAVMRAAGSRWRCWRAAMIRLDGHVAEGQLAVGAAVHRRREPDVETRAPRAAHGRSPGRRRRARSPGSRRMAPAPSTKPLRPFSRHSLPRRSAVRCGAQPDRHRRTAPAAPAR